MKPKLYQNQKHRKATKATHLFDHKTWGFRSCIVRLITGNVLDVRLSGLDPASSGWRKRSRTFFFFFRQISAHILLLGPKKRAVCNFCSKKRKEFFVSQTFMKFSFSLRFFHQIVPYLLQQAIFWQQARAPASQLYTIDLLVCSTKVHIECEALPSLELLLRRCRKGITGSACESRGFQTAPINWVKPQGKSRKQTTKKNTERPKGAMTEILTDL